jgi:putative intracellular protease/amidase
MAPVLQQIYDQMAEPNGRSRCASAPPSGGMFSNYAIGRAWLLHLSVDATFDDVPAPDILLVPGGLDTPRVITDGHPAVDWVRRAHEHTTWTTSVYAGALVLCTAGLLAGHPATTHWYAITCWPATVRSPPNDEW